MEQEKLNEIVRLHKLWLEDEEGGQRANLRNANLRNANLQNADLQNANLRNADLQYANLQYADLQDANLQDANLQYANLQNANLQNANLRNTNLRNANLRNANLRNANLQNADLDYSCWPLWCGSLGVKLDDKQLKQLLYHTLSLIEFNSESELNNIPMKTLKAAASTSHVVTTHGKPKLGGN